MMDTLTALRDALASLPGVATCAVGMEADLTPADYPMVRIVPSRLMPGPLLDGRRQAELLIYFGQPIHEFEGGLPALYASLFDMEAALVDAARGVPGLGFQYRETLLDEDRLDAYKLAAIRAVVLG